MMLTGAIALGGSLWTWLGESWLPLAAVVGITGYYTLSRQVPLTRHVDAATPAAAKAGGQPALIAAPLGVGGLPMGLPGMAFTPDLSATPAPPQPVEDASPEETDAKHDLARFMHKYFVPADEAQRDLQQCVMDMVCGKQPGVRSFVNQGVGSSQLIARHNKARSDILTDIANNANTVTFDDLCDTVKELSQTYCTFCTVCDKLCDGSGLNFREGNQTADPYKKWRALHIALEEGYRDSIRSQKRFGKLFSIDTARRVGHAFVVAL